MRTERGPGEVRESQRAGEPPEVRPPVSGGPGEEPANTGEPGSAGEAGSRPFDSAGAGWPADPRPGERVDHGGCTVADAIRSAMARRS
ncbi:MULTISPECIES: hypothetical protein [Amycolatopsis]|uniref:Uncharacterized protein n=1 Tax=Amycolatopsis albidoflavus TaxID=102226 RepID=A0ABW5HWB5_9PSEU